MKDVIVVDGKEYISVKRASEITGYSKDYIGQLCRAQKISCVMPGRMWWVQEASILAHKKNSDEAMRANGKQILERVPSSPQPLIAPVSIAPAVAVGTYLPPPKWKISYQNDARPLLPELRKTISGSRDIGSIARNTRRRTLRSIRLSRSHLKQIAVLGGVLVFSVASAYAMVDPSGFAKLATDVGSSVAGHVSSIARHDSEKVIAVADQKNVDQKNEQVAAASSALGAWWQNTSSHVVSVIRNWLGIGSHADDLAVTTSTIPEWPTAPQVQIPQAPADPQPKNPTVAVVQPTLPVLPPVRLPPKQVSVPIPTPATAPVQAPAPVAYNTTIYRTDPTLAGRVDQIQGDLNDFKAFQSRQTDTIYESMSRLGTGGGGSTSGGSGSVTSVNVSGGTTGLDFTGGPVTSTGILTLSGILDTANGGTGSSTYSTGEILYGDSGGSLTGLMPGSNGLVLKLQGGVPTWAADISGGGGAGAWATTSDNLAVYPSDTNQVVIVGSNATTSTGNIFEVVGSSKLGGTTHTAALTASSFTLGSLNGLLVGTNGAVSAVATSSLGLPEFSDLSAYLTSASAASTYLSQISAASTYLTQASAASTYLTQANAASTYLSLANFNSQDKGFFFSTTSAAYWLTQRTTDDLTQGSVNKYYSNTLVDGYLSGTGPIQYSSGVISCPTCSTLSFSTTSADYWKTQRDFFSTTSASFFLAQNLGNAFSTTSATYFLGQSQGLAFSTTSSDYWKTQRDFFSTTSADAYINASSTIAHPAGGATGNVIQWDGSKWISVSTSSLNIASNGTGAAYPFALSGNATSTLTQFNGGLTAFASSTIGDGTQIGGLTVNGGATTTANAYIGGLLGIGTTSPYAKLSVDGRGVFNQDIRANYFTSTSTSVASTLPYASSTALTVSGAAYLGSTFLTGITGLTQCLHVNSFGLITGTGSDCGSGGSAAAGSWSTTTSQVAGEFLNYSNNNTDVVAIGSNSTTSAKFFFDPNQQVGYFSGSVGIGTTSPYAALSVNGRTVINQDVRANYFTSTSTTLASTFPYASTTVLSASTLCLSTDCRTAWPSLAYPFSLLGNATSTLTQFNGGLTALASSTVGDGTQGGGLTIFGGATTTGNGYFLGNLGIGTTSPYAKLSVDGRGVFNQDVRANYFTATSTSIASIFPYASTTALTASTLYTTSLCLSSDCRTAWPGYEFAGTGNSTSTLTQFNGGLTAYASSTIGAGGQDTGLTVNGGATTTGLLYLSRGADSLLIGTSSSAYLTALGGGAFNINVSGQTQANVGAAFDTSNPTGFANNMFSSGQLGSKKLGYIGVGGEGLTAGGGYASRTFLESFSTNGLSLIADGSGDIRLYAGGNASSNQKAVLSNGGNFGIGTTSPGSLLSVGNTNGINFSTATSSFSTTGGINLTSGCFAMNGTCITGGGGGSGTINSGTTNRLSYYSGATTLDSASFLALNTGSGFLGIGTSTPWRTLSVTGSSDLGNSALAGFFTATSTTATSTFAGDVQIGDSSAASAFAVDYTGYVGIGTSTPFAQLSIQGTSTASNALFAIATTTGAGQSFLVSHNGTFTVNTPNATSTINGNLYVNGTLRGTNVYSGDLIFANGFRFTEADPGASSTPSGIDGLYLKNQDFSDLFSVDKRGNLTVTGDICSNGAQCYGSSITSLASAVQALASSSALASGAAQSALSSAGSSYSQLTADLGTLRQNIFDLSFRLDGLASTTADLADLRLALDQATSTLASTTADRLATSTSFVAAIANAVKGLIQSTGDWVLARVTAKVAIFDRVETQVAAVSKGFELTDQVTGQMYCVSLRNGDFARTSGACDAAATSTMPAVPMGEFPYLSSPMQPVITAPTVPAASTNTVVSVETSTSTGSTASTPVSTSTPTAPVDAASASSTPLVSASSETGDSSVPVPAPAPATTDVSAPSPDPVPAPSAPSTPASTDAPAPSASPDAPIS